MSGQRGTPHERFWNHVTKGNGCWEWSGALEREGYGKLWLTGNRTALAHRLSWEIHHGEVPRDDVLHRCDNRLCVNPDHLFLGTQADNVHDMVAKERHRRKLSAAQVEEVQRLLELGELQRVLAERFGVSQAAISKIKAKTK